MEYIDPMVETVKDFGRIMGVVECCDKKFYTSKEAMDIIRIIIKENATRSLEVQS